MIYKLFLYGQKELFAYVEIFADIFLKEGDMFYFEGKKYKILRITRTYLRVGFEGDKFKRSINNLPEKQFIDENGAELIITEIPEI